LFLRTEPFDNKEHTICEGVAALAVVSQIIGIREPFLANDAIGKVVFRQVGFATRQINNRRGTFTNAIVRQVYISEAIGPAVAVVFADLFCLVVLRVAYHLALDWNKSLEYVSEHAEF
jgi:hypothetical protein